MTPALEIEDLQASIGELEILRGVNLSVPFGEVHAIMGPNGSGKSTLCHVLTGREEYTVSGFARLGGEEILVRSIDERARMGLMQGFQYPVEIPGVKLSRLVEEAADERGIPERRVRELVGAASAHFGMEPFLDRSVNDDLSGGEKKRSEIFQMAVLGPRVALLDEIDSGLDIDAVREVAEAVEEMRSPEVAVLLITHYSRILRYLSADRIHVMMSGRIVESGGAEIADELEDGGYEVLRRRLGITEQKEPDERRPSDFFTDTPFDV